MRRILLVILVATLLSATLLAQSTSLINQPLVFKNTAGLSQPNPAIHAKMAENYGKLPLSFEANHGQTDSRVKFLSRTSDYSLFLTGDEAVLVLSGKKPHSSVSGHRFSDAASSAREGAPSRVELATSRVLRMTLRNANLAAKVTGGDELASTSNYFIGNDPAKWRTNVPTYAKVKYEGIYSGIDLVYYGNQRQLEYDFIVAPGADPRRIAFNVSGANQICKDAQGELVFKMGEDEIRWHKPVVYQEKEGVRQEIAAHYAITDKNRVGFELAKYDASKPLYIDPLIYSTYLGGSLDDNGYGIAVDGAGNAYVSGWTCSTDFPTLNPLQPDNAGGGNNGPCGDAFVTKINAAGSALVYSTYLGGSGFDIAYGIAVDGTGNAYVTGYTTSKDFPVTSGAFQTACNKSGHNCEDAFVAKLNPTGSALVYAAFLGGNGQGEGYGIAADTEGNAYVTGRTGSTQFPVTPGAFQTTCDGGPTGCANGTDAFVSKINPSGSALVYSTYLGGSGAELGQAIAVDSAGDAYVTGSTDSTDFLTVNPLQPANAGGIDTFVTKFNPAGSALVYSTYLGSNVNDYGNGIAVDSLGNAYIAANLGSQASLFKINPTGSALVYSVGGGFGDTTNGIAVDSSGSAFVIGTNRVGSKNFPQYRVFVRRFDPSGGALGYPTNFSDGAFSQIFGHGIATDGSGNAYITGQTPAGFPTKNPLQPANGGGVDAFVAKIDMRLVTTTTLTSSPNPSVKGQPVTLTAVVSSAFGAPLDGETVTFKKGTKVLGTGTLSGGLASFTISTLPVGTNTIAAVYDGNSTFGASKSKAVKQVVN